MSNEKINPVDSQPCPKCDGQGEKKYRVYFALIILESLSELKKGKPVKELDEPSCWMIIKCPLCKGNGQVDYKKTPIRQKSIAPLGDLEGCLDYFNEVLDKQWNSEDTRENKRIERIHDKSEYLDPEKLVESASKRYFGPIKLDRTLLSKSAEELLEIALKIDELYIDLYPDPADQYHIEKKLEELGLSQYKPDKYAAPGSLII